MTTQTDKKENPDGEGDYGSYPKRPSAIASDAAGQDGIRSGRMALRMTFMPFQLLSTFLPHRQGTNPKKVAERWFSPRIRKKSLARLQASLAIAATW